MHTGAGQKLNGRSIGLVVTALWMAVGVVRADEQTTPTTRMTPEVIAQIAAIKDSWKDVSVDTNSPAMEWWRKSMETRDQRVSWWRDARFGMFIHWGVYSSLGGTWKGVARKGYAEHIQRMFKIPCAEYRRDVAGTFNPTEFDADAWVKLARQAGMGYLVITAKHHDGFAMYDSRVSDYNIMQATPFKRDPMKELKAACDKYGVKLGFYYSHAFDWGEANGAGNDWDYQNPGGDRLLHGVKWWETYPQFLVNTNQYLHAKAIPQVRELIQQYHPAILWFDTPHKLPPEQALEVLKAAREADPNLIINARVVQGGLLGDYASTSDRPMEFPPRDGDWEGVPTTNESYGYNKNDHSHKPASYFIRVLAKAVARGGNILMNIGPMGTGQFDPVDINILEGIGKWNAVNGESIHGCNRTPLTVQAWGESTRKGSTIYLHVFTWPKDGRVTVGGLKAQVLSATLLADSSHAPLKVERLNDLDAIIDGPVDAPDTTDSVIAVQTDGKLESDPSRLLSATGQSNVLRVFDGTRVGAGLIWGDGKRENAYVEGWTDPAASMQWNARLNEPATFHVRINYDALPSSAGGRYTVKVADQTVQATIAANKDNSLDIGTIKLAAGACPVTVQAVSIAGAELMKLRSVTLDPVKSN